METVNHVEDDSRIIHRLTAEDYRLPEAVFMPDTTCEVTVAGRVLRTATNSRLARIDIYDPSSFPELPEGVQPESLFGTAHFQAWLEEFKGARMVKWSVKNQDPQSADLVAKHPGIHPRWLLSRSLTFLDQISADEGLGPIKYLEGRWMKPDPGRSFWTKDANGQPLPHPDPNSLAATFSPEQDAELEQMARTTTKGLLAAYGLDYNVLWNKLSGVWWDVNAPGAREMWIQSRRDAESRAWGGYPNVPDDPSDLV